MPHTGLGRLDIERYTCMTVPLQIKLHSSKFVMTACVTD